MRRIGILAAAAAVLGVSSNLRAETKRIFVLPPVQWDKELSRDRPAQNFSRTDLGNLTGGIMFGQKPSEVNAHLPSPNAGIDWASLPSANEYPTDVR